MPNRDTLWMEAKHKCRLDDRHIAMAKELNISPISLIKNIPNRGEPWKVPVSVWLETLYEKKQKKIRQRQKRKDGKPKPDGGDGQ